MYIHLIKSRHEKVIQSIIDKIDLDVDADFGYGQYVIMSDMESLYQELRERIIASKRKISNVSWLKNYVNIIITIINFVI